MTKKNIRYITDYINDENNIIKYEAGYRGGGCKWDLSELLDEYNLKIDTYNRGDVVFCSVAQNYLGGGIAGRIIFSGVMNEYHDELDFSKTIRSREFYDVLKDVCINFFYNLNDGGGDDYMVNEVNTLENVQSRPYTAFN